MHKPDGLPDREIARRLLYHMHLTRKFEEYLLDAYRQKKLYGTIHLAIGEEGAGAGTCLALEEQDLVFATHRNHPQAICKGADVCGMMAEIFSKENGLCKGRGGSMHIAHRDKGVMGANGIVGAAVAIACGTALADKRRGDGGRVSAAFFGDGAVNEGVVSESMNLATLWQLPVLFVLVDNQYGISTHKTRANRDADLSKRARPYGIPVLEVDGNDVWAVFSTVKEARQQICRDGGPVMVVEHTYRISGHSKSDDNRYRTQEELAYWEAKAPIPRFCRLLLDNAILSQEELESVEAQASAEIARAAEFAQAGKMPDPRTVGLYVYAD